MKGFKMEERCPHCGGELKVKGWSNNRTVRRYICKSCGKGCCDTTLHKVFPKKKECPHCHSTNTKTGGVLKSGAQRYICNDCGKGFSDNTVIKEPCTVKCPKCGSLAPRCGNTKAGKQRYLCKECNYKFVENPLQNTERYVKHNKTCPVCGHIWAKKAGKSNDKQYYICLKCNHKFLEGGTQRYTTPKQKEQIVERIKQGQSAKEIAHKFQINEKTVRNVCAKSKGFKEWRLTQIEQNTELKHAICTQIMHGHAVMEISKKYDIPHGTINDWLKPYYKSETLTNAQKGLIYKFGVQLAIPVEYLAEYIPCSRKICSEFLSNYKIEKPKRAERTEVEKYNDNLILDRFTL